MKKYKEEELKGMSIAEQIELAMKKSKAEQNRCIRHAKKNNQTLTGYRVHVVALNAFGNEGKHWVLPAEWDWNDAHEMKLTAYSGFGCITIEEYLMGKRISSVEL